MKKLRGLMALVLAAAMTLGTGGVGMVSALAEGNSSLDPGHEIKISVQTKNINGDTYADSDGTNETYTAYRIFDYTATQDALTNNTFDTTDENVHSDGTQSDGISYFIKNTSPFITLFWKEGQKVNDERLNWFNLTPSSNGDVYYVTMSDGAGSAKEENAKKLAEYINAHLSPDGRTLSDGATDNIEIKSDGTGVDEAAVYRYALTSSTEITTGGDVIYSAGVLPGYYLITSSLGSNLIAATSDITITEKNEYPAVTKKINDSSDVSKSIGDTITFTLTVTIPGEANKALTLVDTMSPSLTLMTNSFTVQSDGTDVGATNFAINYKTDIANSSGTYSSSNNVTYHTATASDGADLADSSGSFQIVFKDDYVKDLKAKTTITITYDAILNSTATTASGGEASATNDVYLKYSHYQSPVDPTNSETEIYTYDFDLVKYWKDGSTQPLLANAQFNLYRSDGIATGNDGKATVSDGTAKIMFAHGTDSGGNYRVYDKLENTKTTDTITSRSDGALNIQGLAAGTYYLQEIEAPAGYNRLSDLVKVVIEANGKTSYVVRVDNSDKATTPQSNTPTDNTTNTVTYSDGGVSVLNSTGTELPSTGGIGTTIFYVVGGILVLGAGVLLITKRRVRSR